MKSPPWGPQAEEKAVVLEISVPCFIKKAEEMKSASSLLQVFLNF